jgi:hypothetical protein
MLVLAMEFSRGAQRAHGTAGIEIQTDTGARWARASGRHSRGEAGIASEGLESARAARRAGTEGHSLKTE